MDPTVLLTLGVPALVAALTMAVRTLSKAFADARVKSADAAMTVASAKKLEAEADRIRAEAARAREETTGRFARVAEEGYRDARKDLSDCEQLVAAVRTELDTERVARVELGEQCEERERVSALRIMELVDAHDRDVVVIGELAARVAVLERRSLSPGGGS